MPLDVIDQQLHLHDLLHLVASDAIGEIAHARVADIGLAGIVDGDRMVGNHRLHEGHVIDQRLSAIDGE